MALSETEREEALAYLTRPDLVPAILADMDALGAVGEEDAKLMVYLIGTSRKQDKPLAGVVLSQSGAGQVQLDSVGAGAHAARGRGLLQTGCRLRRPATWIATR